MTTRRRIGHRQLQQLQNQLSQRDTSVLRSLQRYRLLTVSQLQRLHFTEHASVNTANRVTRRVLNRLHHERLVGRLERRIGGIRAGSAGHIYTLTPLGHRLLGETTRKRWHEPNRYFVEHTLAISETAVNIMAGAEAGNYKPLNVAPEPTAWRHYTDGLAPVVLKPDLYAEVANNDYELRWFVEIDRATESSTVVARKCEQYVDYWRSGTEQQRHGIFPKVLWIVPTNHRLDQIHRICSAAHDSPFDVCLAADAQAHLTSFPKGDNQQQETKGP